MDAEEIYKKYKHPIKQAVKITRETGREVGFSDTHPSLVIGTPEEVEVHGKVFVVHTHPKEEAEELSELDKLALEVGTYTMCVVHPGLEEDYFTILCLSRDIEAQKTREDCIKRIKKVP